MCRTPILLINCCNYTYVQMNHASGDISEHIHQVGISQLHFILAQQVPQTPAMYQLYSCIVCIVQNQKRACCVVWCSRMCGMMCNGEDGVVWVWLTSETMHKGEGHIPVQKSGEFFWRIYIIDKPVVRMCKCVGEVCVPQGIVLQNVPKMVTMFGWLPSLLKCVCVSGNVTAKVWTYKKDQVTHYALAISAIFKWRQPTTCSSVPLCVFECLIVCLIVWEWCVCDLCIYLMLFISFKNSSLASFVSNFICFTTHSVFLHLFLLFVCHYSCIVCSVYLFVCSVCQGVYVLNTYVHNKNVLHTRLWTPHQRHLPPVSGPTWFHCREWTWVVISPSAPNYYRLEWLSAVSILTVAAYVKCEKKIKAKHTERKKWGDEGKEKKKERCKEITPSWIGFSFIAAFLLLHTTQVSVAVFPYNNIKYHINKTLSFTLSSNVNVCVLVPNHRSNTYLWHKSCNIYIYAYLAAKATATAIEPPTTATPAPIRIPMIVAAINVNVHYCLHTHEHKHAHTYTSIQRSTTHHTRTYTRTDHPWAKVETHIYPKTDHIQTMRVDKCKQLTIYTF